MKARVIVAATLVTLLAACCLAAAVVALLRVDLRAPWVPTPTPPPGWYGDVRELFVDEAVFPEGWRADLYLEVNVHPRANHVLREFGFPETSKRVMQDIWRAYTSSDAHEKYDELRGTQFQPSRPLPEGQIFVPFEPPEEISCESQVADEFYLACGWWRAASCRAVARYRNYVVLLRLDHEAEREGHHTDGMTYSEIETVVRGMDAKFEQVFEAFAGGAP